MENQSNTRSEGLKVRQNIFSHSSAALNLFIIHFQPQRTPPTLISNCSRYNDLNFNFPNIYGWSHADWLTHNKPKVFINSIIWDYGIVSSIIELWWWWWWHYDWHSPTVYGWIIVYNIRELQSRCPLFSSSQLFRCKSQVFPNTERTRSFVIKIWFGTQIINKYDFYTEDNDFFHTINGKISKENDHKLNVYII